MITKRIIPCLDIKDGRTVKGTNFKSIRDAGDPLELATQYEKEGADELVFLDITATERKAELLTELVIQLSRKLSIPFTVGGGINSVASAYSLLRSGADKIAVNSAAVRRPELLSELSEAYGAQCIVLAIDAKFIKDEWWVYTHGGKKITERRLFEWAKEGVERGAGEILFTSMDNDGTKKGFACDALSQLNEQLNVPIIASGGAGKVEHFKEVFEKSNTSAALAASIFHYQEISLLKLKNYLDKQGIKVRITE